ncbi:MAG: hypothetical protein ACYCZ2_18740 [Lutibacter sp.]
MTTKELIENVILNENAYFFQKSNSNFLPKRLIERTFREASINKAGRFLLKKVSEETKVNGKKIKFSICVYKYPNKPTFIKEKISEWEETKLAYICIVDFKNYVSVSKRNISGTKELYKYIMPIDYSILTSIFINDTTSFEKFSMNNMNISDKSIRTKSVEAIDLKENLSTLGLQSYVLNNLRLSNDNDKISLTLNSSRINKFGNKNSIDFFIKWSDIIIDKIENYQPKDSFLSTFATPQDFEKERDNLKPIAILILFQNLFSDFEENRIDSCTLKLENGERNIDIIKAVDNFKRLLKIVEVNNNGKTIYKLINSIANDLIVLKNPKSITLRSKKLSKIIIKLSDDNEISIIDYLNRTNSFIINFDIPDLIYSNRKLFKDNRLLGNIDSFLSVLKPYPELSSVKSEKGIFSPASKEFSDDSIFKFVEDKFKSSSEFFICDDLGKEWADHIGLYNDSISFFHSKYKDSKFSASAFQDIIGQAQKNLGNLCPSENQWPSKENFWSNKYNINEITTDISRIRKGSSAKDSIDYFKNLKLDPNLSKKVYLVINFISKKDLADRLDKLKNGISFQEKNEVIQILWFISSLVNSCYEVNAEVYILCKE